MANQLKLGIDSAEVVRIEGDEIRVTSPEGVLACMKLTELFDRVTPRRLDTRDLVLPDGVKSMTPTTCGLVLVHQTPPRVWSFKWIAEDSSTRWGRGTKYRQARLALPYLIVLAVFEEGPGGVPQLSGRNECFFANQPLEREGLDTPLSYPALLNCSRFRADPGHSLAWVCTQHLPRPKASRATDLASSVRDGLGALLRHLLETGFNFSSEDHELNSWYSETVAAGVDERIASVAAWEAASVVEPLFALEVPWLETGRTLREIVQRIVDLHGEMRPAARHASDLARVVFNAQEKSRRSS